MNFFDNGHGAGLPNGAVLQHLQARVDEKFAELGQHGEHDAAHMELPHGLPDFAAFHLATDFADHFLPAHFPDDHLFL